MPYNIFFICEFKASLVGLDPKITKLYRFSFRRINWRKFTISEYCLNLSFPIYTGNKLNLIKINRNKVGFKFGNFCDTKKYPIYMSKKKKKAKKKK